MESMKNGLRCLLSTLLLVFMTSPLCYAQLTHVDGLACWDGDKNLPLVGTGSHAGTVVDVSSARIISDKNQYIDTEADGYFVSYDSNRIAKGNPVVFRYYKKAGQVLVKFSSLDGFYEWNRSLCI